MFVTGAVLLLLAQQPPATRNAPTAAQLAAALATLRAGDAAAGDRQQPSAECAAAAEQLARAMPALVQASHPLHAELLALCRQRAGELLPSLRRPIRAGDPLLRTLVRFDGECALQAPVDGMQPHPAAAAFPGAVAADAAPIAVEVEIDLAVPGRHSLGLYAAPAARIDLRLLSDAPPPADLRLRIGSHSDDIGRRDRWPRPPRISRTFAFDRRQLTAANAFGGLVQLEVGKPASGRLRVAVAGAVPAPLFVLGRTDAEAWRRSREAPGPWAELATDKVILTVPARCVRELDDPAPVLRFWDRALDAAADLAARPRQRQRPERYCADVEISAGYMHSGYPIMTHLDAADDMVDLARMQQGPWGLFHELGHNHQDRSWTFAGTTEVTVNLFSLYLCEVLCGKDRLQAWGGNLRKAQARLGEVLARGERPWGDEQKPDLALRLLMYSQLQQAFGWNAFRRCFAGYRELAPEQRPRGAALQRDQWLLRMSRAVGRDLGPFFTAWGVETSAAARAELQGLPAWMPDDWPRPR